MEHNRFKVMLNMSSDHAGIAEQLARLERELYGVIAHTEDARKVRDYLIHLRAESARWCSDKGVDMRGWIQRTRKAAV